MPHNEEWKGGKIVELEVRLKILETVKDDMELRLRRIERNMYIATGAIMMLQFILKLIKV